MKNVSLTTAYVYFYFAYDMSKVYTCFTKKGY